MQKVLCVGIGGFIGSILRYLIALHAPNLIWKELPSGTLLVNVAGAFLIAFVLELSLNLTSPGISPELRLFLTTGIMGGFTTFSTFSYESFALLSEGRYHLGLLNICLNVFLGLGGAALGHVLAHRLFAGG